MINTNINSNNETESDPDKLSSYKNKISDRIIDIDHLADELIIELEEELNNKGDYEYFEDQDQYLFVPVHHEEAFFDLMKLRINIIKRFTKILNPNELVAIRFNIGVEAEVSVRPGDRQWLIIKEISRSQDLKKFGILNKYEFIGFLQQIDSILFYELTEILLKSHAIGFCQVDQPITLEKKLRNFESINQISPDQEESKNNFI
jgi:DNA-binding Lrp family transcriptional regulator